MFGAVRTHKLVAGSDPNRRGSDHLQKRALGPRLLDTPDLVTGLNAAHRQWQSTLYIPWLRLWSAWGCKKNLQRRLPVRMVHCSMVTTQRDVEHYCYVLQREVTRIT